MKIKMIAADMDDTLLNRDRSVSERTKKTLLAAQEKGVYVVLASGRPVPAMIACAKELELDRFGSYIISYNGAVIYDCRQQKTVFEQKLSNELLLQLYDISSREDIYIHTYSDDAIITDDICRHTEFESSLTGMPIQKVESFRDAVKGDVIKAMLLDDPEKIRRVHDSLLEWAEGRISMTISKPFFLEFMHHEVDKGAALKRLASMLNIEMESIVAFGDSYNDITMLEYAGTGVAMGNAKDDVKAIADFVTDCNNSDGIANHLAQYGF